MTPRPFRFGAVGVTAPTAEAWRDCARKVEGLGYSTLVTGDHIAFGFLAPLQALLAAANATRTLRLATHVLANDFRNPVMLAHELTTLDLLSDGRLEFGIGAGWLGLDYAAAGIPFDPPGARVGRLEEAVPLFKRLFGDEPVTFTGDHYRVHDLNLQPKPRQRPYPPLYIGGAGKRILSLAGREANIVGLDIKGTKDGGKDAATISAQSTAEKVEWIRQVAGERFGELELHVLVNKVVVTDDRRRGVADVAAWLRAFPWSILANVETDAEALLQSPHLLVGSVDQIIEDLQERRECYGISYVTVGSEMVDAFAPVVERLVGT